MAPLANTISAVTDDWSSYQDEPHVAAENDKPTLETRSWIGAHAYLAFLFNRV